MRFNPPPNWPPSPPGWTPPPGWEPDPSWPPPPPAWPLWVSDPPARSGRKGLIISCVVAAIAVVAIVATVLVVVLTRESKPSDEEQIRAVLTGMQNAWNEENWNEFKGFVCEASMQDDPPTNEALQEDRDQQGRSELVVKSLEITGDKASASVEQTYENNGEPDTEDVDFVREGDDWKVCFTEQA